MSNESDELTETHYKRVLACIRSLPDDKISATRVEKELDDPDFDVHRALQDLVLLGEVELCQVRGTGGRIWLKRRATNRDSDGPEVIDSVWRCYVAKDYRDRIADRLFGTREAAVKHLEESAVADVRSLEPVSYLEDVWYAEAAAAESGYTALDAVVRREPIYDDSVSTE